MATPTQHPKIIGLTGPAGSGKDSVADAICHLTGAARIAFADALRAEICAGYQVPLAYLINRNTKEHPMSALALRCCSKKGFIDAMVDIDPAINLDAPQSPRWVLQRWGTQYRRAQNPLYWQYKALRRIGSAVHIHKKPCVVLTDVRFADEAQTVTDLGGEIWRVERPGYGVGEGEGSHCSETTGAEFNPARVIDNSAGIAELLERVREALGAGN